METKRYTKNDLDEVVEALKNKEVIAFPTDTVYGLGVIYDEEALAALKQAKGRPENKPIPTMVSSIEQMQRIAVMNPLANCFANTFMPGGFTMVLDKQACVPAFATNGLNTIGIRIPDDEFVLALLNKIDGPLLVTSANLSGEETGMVDTQVLAQLDGRIHGIVLGEASGQCSSTIVAIKGQGYTLLREGEISKQQLDAVVLKEKYE